MDKVAKHLPIRHRKLNHPIVFALNIPTTHYAANRDAYYKPILNSFKSQPGVKDQSQIYLLPNIVSPQDTIEERAKMLAHKLKAFKRSKVHLVTHSFTGIDARAAISMYDGGDRVRSLTTICTPHLGLRLIDNARKFPEQYGDLAPLDKAFEVLGMSTDNAAEFTHKNMEAFNEVVTDHENV